jgi:hypothetical protein
MNVSTAAFCILSMFAGLGIFGAVLAGVILTQNGIVIG